MEVGDVGSKLGMFWEAVGSGLVRHKTHAVDASKGTTTKSSAWSLAVVGSSSQSVAEVVSA